MRYDRSLKPAGFTGACGDVPQAFQAFGLLRFLGLQGRTLLLELVRACCALLEPVSWPRSLRSLPKPKPRGHVSARQPASLMNVPFEGEEEGSPLNRGVFSPEANGP